MHLSSKRRDGHHARATTALAVGAAIALLAGGSAALAASDAVRAPSCTAQQGQAFIDQGRYDHAVREFTCVIDAAPTEPEGYRGRMEAQVLLGRFSDAVGDCTRVYAYVVPVHADYQKTMLAGYASRLAVSPNSVTALTGASFLHWCFFDYPAAIHVLNRLLDLRPDDVYGNLFRGSSRVLKNAMRARGVEDLERAIALAPDSPDVHFIVADAYTYGLPDPSGPSQKHRRRSPEGSTRRASTRSSRARTPRSATCSRRRSTFRCTSTWSPHSSFRPPRSHPEAR